MTLAERWFRPKAFERDGRLYWWFGVVAFKRLLMRIVQVDCTKPRPRSNAYVLAGQSLQCVRAFEHTSRRSELIHLGGLAIGIVFIALGAVFGGLTTAGIIVFAMNFHCFALQRFNRARIYRLLRRAEDRRSHDRW